ncbi:unnamed protein product [Penicillium egyptiacum]|uniref:Uncharacterized protein n=1 Tax=Penicillium egyptiacum TaxID=1303716 RepID=A0A9W4KA77_9EURO|nr:unnamed protein product [Penicillium egyptiacum]
MGILLIGSGKSSLSKWILSNHLSFKRLSIDSFIYAKYGLYGVDYPEDKYNHYQSEAERALRDELAQLLQQGSQDAILDLSFAFRKSRNEWKDLIERSGGRWVLAYLDVGVDELRRRVRARNELAVKDGDSAFFVTNEILEFFIAGFERPIGEGEVVLRLNNEFNTGTDL